MVCVGVLEASSSTHPCTYDVFLSFRGEDTRKTFTDHLYAALLGAGFLTFKDDDGIPRCENVKSELDKAIKEARCSIVVFSKNYASSSWCLDELVMILERKRTSRHAILPLFYDVDPSQVRNQTGSFAEAFHRFEERSKVDANEWKKVKGWQAALREVADLAGMNLQNQADRHESKFIQKIISVIGDKLSRKSLYVASCPIGIDTRVKSINSWLQHDSGDVSIAVICGMGGIGKTTIAKFVYNSNYKRFEACSFLSNIREASEQPKGLIGLQKQLLSNILKRGMEEIYSVDEGKAKIRDAIGCKKVLVVLDDVDQRDQLDAVMETHNWFHPGSKIILTTRRKDLLNGNEVYQIYKVNRFNDDESIQLFSRHAFGQDHPIEGYFEHSKRAVQQCRGLPLALKVLGSSLSGKSLDIWESALHKLAAIPDSQILKKLQISYDSLQDDHDKNLFLHVSCFFVGKCKDFIVTILDGCGFHSTIGIQNLIDRCLVTINKANRIIMHQLIRDMGREIVRQESPKESGKRSRLWNHMDSFNVLRENTGTESIEGLLLDMHLLGEDKCLAERFGIGNGKWPRIQELTKEILLSEEENSSKRQCLGFLSWLPVGNYLKQSDKVALKLNVFSKMNKLRLLQLNDVAITGGYKDFPKSLSLLCWRGFPLKSIPSDFSLESLVTLELQHSRLEQLWKGNKSLRLLKTLNLSYSLGLTNTSTLTGLPCLENLILKGCFQLVEVHESIGDLRRLVFLNLNDCKNLKKLPNRIVNLVSLEKLILSGCSRLDQLPAELGRMKSLKELYADGLALNRTPTTTSEVKSWRSVFLSLIPRPSMSKESIYFPVASLPRSLVNLSLSNCNLSNDDLERSLDGLSLLRYLNLSGNPISSLPQSIKGHGAITSLVLSDCKKLRSLPRLPTNLFRLRVAGCESLEIMANPQMQPGFVNVIMTGCKNLGEVQGVFKLEPIGNADARMLSRLGLVDLKSLESLEIKITNRITRTMQKLPLQVLFERGIYSICLPGKEKPASWFNYSKGIGSCISVTVPNFRFKAFNVRVVLEDGKGIRKKFFLNSIKIANNTRGKVWLYYPVVFGIPDGRGMVWLSHWTTGHLLMEGGDEVTVTASWSPDIEIREIGVQFVYEENCQSSSAPYEVNALSKYYNAEGTFQLPHFRNVGGAWEYQTSGLSAGDPSWCLCDLNLWEGEVISI